MKNKPLACVSLDLDNMWSYMKTHGDEDWDSYPSYYNIFVPYILEILREIDVRITFFIVGLDADVSENKFFLKLISNDGHDFGNHSYNHDVWINELSREQIELELDKTESSILNATGKRPSGFRGPGFSWNKTILEILYDKNYLYDATTLPTFIGPLARMYYFWKSDFNKDEKSKRSNLFGPLTEGFRRLRPYYFLINKDKKILEIPVTTIPFFRIPFHMSYLIYLSRISPWLMKTYLHLAIFMCRLTSTPISFLLHPLDIIGGDKIRKLSFFPGMDVNSESKIKVFKYVMKVLKKYYTLVDMNTFAENFISKSRE